MLFPFFASVVSSREWQFTDEMSLVEIIRMRYAQFEAFDIRGQEQLIMSILMCIYLTYVLYRVMMRHATARLCEAKAVEMYTEALRSHAHRSALYLRLFDLIIIAEPSEQDERQEMKQRLRTRLKEVPADLCLSALDCPNQISEFGTVEQWADKCWHDCVISSSQKLTTEQWLDRVNRVAGSHHDLELESPPALVKVAFLAALSIDFDLPGVFFEVLMSYDILRACGVHFSPEEMTSFSAEAEFITVLTKRLYDAGFTLLSLMDGRSDIFLFLQIRDIPAVQDILRALHPAIPSIDQVKRGRLYGEKRILNSGESYLFPGLTVEEETEKVQARSNQSGEINNKNRFRTLTILLITATAGAALYVVYAGTIQFMKWGCTTYPRFAWVAASVIDSWPKDIVVTSMSAVMVHLIVQNILVFFGEPPSHRPYHRCRTRPATVPIPNELLQL